MDKERLARADEIVASLSAGKREMVREIVINAIQRGQVDRSAQQYLTRATGGSELAETLADALQSERAAGAVDARRAFAGLLER